VTGQDNNGLIDRKRGRHWRLRARHCWPTRQARPRARG
jgi:hypothetical protein